MYPMGDAERFRAFPPNREHLPEYQASGANCDVTRLPSSEDSTYMHLQNNRPPPFRSNVTPRGLDIGPHGGTTFGMQEEPARRNDGLDIGPHGGTTFGMQEEPARRNDGLDKGPHGGTTFGMQEEPARRNEALLRNSATRLVSAEPRPVQHPPPNHGVSTLPLFPGADLIRNRAEDEPPLTGATYTLPNILRKSSGSLPPIAAARASLGLGRTSAFHHVRQREESEDVRPQANVVVNAPDFCAHHEKQLPPPANRPTEQLPPLANRSAEQFQPPANRPTEQLPPAANRPTEQLSPPANRPTEQLPPPANRPTEQFWDEMRQEFQELKRCFHSFVQRNMNLDSAATSQLRPQPAASIPCGAPTAYVIHHRPASHVVVPHPYPAGYVEASHPRFQHVQNMMHQPARVARHVSAPGIINFSTHVNEERMRMMSSDSAEAASMPRDFTNINEPAFGQFPYRRAYDLNATPESVDTNEPMDFVDAPAPQTSTAGLVNGDHIHVHQRHIMSPPSHVGAMCNRTCPAPSQLQPQRQPGDLGHLSHPQQQLGVFRQPTLNYQLRQPQQQPQGFAPPAANRQYAHQRVSLPHQQPQEQPGDILRQTSAPRQQDPHPARVFTPSVIHDMGPTRGASQSQQPQQEHSGAFYPHAHMLSPDQMTPFACRHAHMLPRPQPGPVGGYAPPQPRSVGGHVPPYEQARPLGGRPPLPWRPRPFRGHAPPHIQSQRIGQHLPLQELPPAGASEGNAPPQEQQPMPFGGHPAIDVLPGWTNSPHPQAPGQPGLLLLHPQSRVQSATIVSHGNMMRPQEEAQHEEANRPIVRQSQDEAQPEEANLPIVRHSQEEGQPGVIIGSSVAPPPEPQVQPRRKRGRPVRPRPQEQMQPANNINIAAPAAREAPAARAAPAAREARAAPAAPQPQPIIPVQQQNVIEQSVQVSHGTGDPTLEEAHVIVVGRVGGAVGEGGGDGARTLDQHVPVRCDPFAPCVNCLAFFGVPAMPLPRGYLRAHANGVAHYHDYEDPPVLDNAAQLPVQRRRQSRHGPKSQSSEFRGVTFYKRTGRWEAHIWHNNAQVYLGASQTKEDAARAYDRAALLLTGPTADINFTPEDYRVEITHLYKLSKEQLIIYVRRDSRGKGAQAKYPGVKKIGNDRYQAAYKPDLKAKMCTILGLYGSEGDASRVIFNEALRRNNHQLAALIMNTHHVRSLPSYIAAHEAADGIVEDTAPGRAAKSAKKKPAAAKRKRTPKSKVVAKVPGAPRLRRQTTAKAPVVNPPSPPAATAPGQKRKRQTKTAAAAST